MRKVLLLAIAVFVSPVFCIGQESADSTALDVSYVVTDGEDAGLHENGSGDLVVEENEDLEVSAQAVEDVSTSEFTVADSAEGEYVQLPDSLVDDSRLYKRFNPDPDKAVWFSAVLPGLGQIYNRQYWKLPIIYGGFLGIAYAITWNNQMYVDYRKAYVDLIDSDPDTRSYEKLLPAGTTIDDSNRSTYERTFQNGQETYLRYRDLSIILGGVLYILTMIDAYVDAQLHDYDISPDLSLKVTPAIIPASQNREIDTSVGVRCKFRF